MIRRPPRSTRKESSAASDVYKRQDYDNESSKLAKLFSENFKQFNVDESIIAAGPIPVSK